MKNDMPEEILIYMGAASGHPQILREEQNTVNAVKYVRADLTEPVIDDGLLAEAVKWIQCMWPQVSNRAPQDDEAMAILLTHALKGQSK